MSLNPQCSAPAAQPLPNGRNTLLRTAAAPVTKHGPNAFTRIERASAVEFLQTRRIR